MISEDEENNGNPDNNSAQEEEDTGPIINDGGIMSEEDLTPTEPETGDENNGTG